MLKRILSLVLIFSFLITQPLFVFAEDPDYGDLAGQFRIAPKDKIIPKEEGYEKVVCPTCRKPFEIKVDPNDLEFQRGAKRMVCPYDGTEFYTKSEEDAQRELQYQTIKCPSCGKEFRSYVDVNAILTGQSQLLTCPYDKKKFYFKVEPYAPAAIKLANMQTVMCPTDKMTFKAYIDPENPKELTCPYDGTRFMPTPELIPELRMASPIAGNRAGAGITGGQGLAGSAMGDVMQPNLVQEGVSVMPVEEKPSRVEEMFFNHVPLTVSTAIKQFGYEIFRPKEKAVSEKPGEETTSGKQEKGLLKTLLSSQQGGENAAGAGGGMEGGPSDFISPMQIPVISDYVLGPGDVLQISIWGQIQETFPITVDVDGKIQLPKVGPLYVWGLKFSEAEKQIRESMMREYANIHVSVSMGQLRGIKVFVLGEARKPGSYTISALSDSFNALYAAGGPSKLGSMRKIRLVRKGSSDMPIDMYNILLKGDNTQDYKLQSGDTLFIPPIGDVVGVAGNVKRPAIYELNGKAKLSEVIEMAGGVSSVGYVQRIQLERIQDHLRKVVMDLEFKSLSDLKDSGNNLDIQDGDLILIFPITQIRHNFVSASGSVLRPGDYELKNKMRLKDLIDSAGGLLPGTYLKRAEIARFNGSQEREIIAVNLAELMDGKEETNISLKEWDIITVYSKKEILPTVFVEIDGAVNKPGQYELTENLKISDLIFKAGGLKKNALTSNAELFRSYSDAESKMFNIDLAKVLSKDSEESGKNDLVLEEGDHLFIRADVSREEKTVVTLNGEFKYPGKYAVEKGARISAVINMAGGFKNTAYLDGCVYTRESVKRAQEKALKNFLEMEQQALLQESASMAVGTTTVQAEGKSKLVEYRKNLINKLESLEMPGRILIRFNPSMHKFENSEYDIIVEDGDTLTVGTAPGIVQVVGNVYGAGVVTFSEGKGVDYYINRTGGLTKYADANRIFVIRSNGETVSSFVRAVKIRRGDVIVVPEEFKYRTLPGIVIKDIMQVIYQATLGAAVVITAMNTL